MSSILDSWETTTAFASWQVGPITNGANFIPYKTSFWGWGSWLRGTWLGCDTLYLESFEIMKRAVRTGFSNAGFWRIATTGPNNSWIFCGSFILSIRINKHSNIRTALSSGNWITKVSDIWIKLSRIILVSSAINNSGSFRAV